MKKKGRCRKKRRNHEGSGAAGKGCGGAAAWLTPVPAQLPAALGAVAVARFLAFQSRRRKP